MTKSRRISLSLDETDPESKRVIAILEEKGHSKAKFVTAAVLHYINCTVRASERGDEEYIRSIVYKVLRAENLIRTDGAGTNYVSEEQPDGEAIPSDLISAIADSLKLL